MLERVAGLYYVSLQTLLILSVGLTVITAVH